MNVSELLASVIDGVTLNSTLLINLTAMDNLTIMMKAAFPNSLLEQTEAIDFVIIEAMSSSSLAVLKTIVAVLADPLPMELLTSNADEYNRLNAIAKDCTENIHTCLIPLFRDMGNILTTFMTSKSDSGNSDLLLQSKSLFPRLGDRGLQLVQLVECLVRLNYENVDRELCESGVLSTIVDMMFYYHHNSILHLSVQKLLLNIIQSGDYKRYVV